MPYLPRATRGGFGLWILEIKRGLLCVELRTLGLFGIAFRRKEADEVVCFIILGKLCYSFIRPRTVYCAQGQLSKITYRAVPVDVLPLSLTGRPPRRGWWVLSGAPFPPPFPPHTSDTRRLMSQKAFFEELKSYSLFFVCLAWTRERRTDFLLIKEGSEIHYC